MDHIKQFVELKDDDKGNLYLFLNLMLILLFSGLGYWSEQAFEAVHANFKQSWENVKVDIDHTEYLPKLKNSVTRYNSSHI